MVWLGHLLRAAEEDATRQTVLGLAELQLRGEIEENGGILMDAPAFLSAGELIWMAGGSGSEEDVKVKRKQWKE